jgi:hypothetical protein
MAITASDWSTKYHVHLRRVTDTCQAYTVPKLKQTLAMSCYEEYIIPVRATIDCIYRTSDFDRYTASRSPPACFLTRPIITTSHTVP